MSKHSIDLSWSHAANPVVDDTYTRNHQLTLNPGLQVMASASPEHKGDPACTDPEQLVVSALASCHMLTFLAIAELKGFSVTSYDDNAVGYLEKGDSGKPEVTRIELQPKIVFSGEHQPDAATQKRMHTSAHRNCFIANTLKTQVDILE